MSLAQLSRSAPPTSSRSGNRLLDLLPEADLAGLLAGAERVTLAAEAVLAEAGEPARHAHFPLSAVISIVTPLRDGTSVEMAVVGSEGMAGIGLLTDLRMSVHRLVCPVEGESLRLPAATFRELLAGSRPLYELVARYALTLVYWGEQIALCNLRHDVEQRMCRCLLTAHERAGRDKFGLSRESLGVMLGLRPQGVSLAIDVLRQAGLIGYAGGWVTVLDPPGLEAAACGCHAGAEDTYLRVMGRPA
jgi:CRP-like cAMP-binding protein